MTQRDMTERTTPPPGDHPTDPHGFARPGPPPAPAPEVPGSRPGPFAAAAPAPRAEGEHAPLNTVAVLALVFAFVLAPVGVVLGIVGRRQVDRSGERGRGLATAGLVLSVAFLVLGVVIAVLAGVLAAAASTSTPTVSATDVASQIAATRATQAQCPEDLRGEVGSSVVCNAVLDGRPVRVEARVTSTDGGVVKFDLTQVG